METLLLYIIGLVYLSLASRRVGQPSSKQTDTILPREGGDIGLFITLVLKVQYYLFLFVDLATLGTFDFFLH